MKQTETGRQPAVMHWLAGAWVFVLLAPVFLSIALLDGFLHPRRTSKM